MRRAKAFLSKIVTGAFAQTMTLRLVQRRLEVGALSTFLELGTLSRFEASYFKTPTTPPTLTLTHARAHARFCYGDGDSVSTVSPHRVALVFTFQFRFKIMLTCAHFG